MHLHSGFLLVHSGVDTSMTLDAAKWNCAGGELSSCVINNHNWIMYHNIQNITYILFCFMYLYMFMYCDLHA